MSQTIQVDFRKVRRLKTGRPPLRIKAKPRPRPTPGTMNKLEERYKNEVLEPRLRAGEILSYKFEGMKLRLARKTFYTPDFVVVTPELIELHEVKGHWEDDARCKIKVAAEQAWWFQIIAIRYERKQWIYERF